MTEVEKAQELYFKYYMKVADGSFPENNAKQCALIAVDEILKALESDWSFMEIRQEYWQEVKQELNKSE